MNYKEYNEKIRTDINSFPMIFAFSDQQLYQGMDTLGVKHPSELCAIGCNGFIRKKDKVDFLHLMSEHKRLFSECLLDADFCYSMFLSEMANHEYIITYDDEEVLEACQLKAEDLQSNDMLQEMFLKAKKQYLAAY